MNRTTVGSRGKRGLGTKRDRRLSRQGGQREGIQILSCCFEALRPIDAVLSKKSCMTRSNIISTVSLNTRICTVLNDLRDFWAVRASTRLALRRVCKHVANLEARTCSELGE